MKKIYTLLFLLGTLFNIQAQDIPFNSVFNIKWDVNVPLANRDYLKNTSFAGFEIEGKWKVASNFTMGLSANWTTYYKYEDRQTYSQPGIDITTDLYKYVYCVPVTINAQYHFVPGDRVIPYAGIGVGTNYMNSKLLFNTYQYSQDSWGLAVRPEIGAMIYLGRESTTALHTGLRYSYFSNGASDFGYKGFQAIGLQLGFSFLM